MSVVKQEICQERSLSLEQMKPIKEEQEELWTSHQITSFPSSPVPVKSEDVDEEAQSIQLHQRQTEENREETDGGDCGGSEPHLQTSDEMTEDSEDSDEDWTLNRELKSELKQKTKPPASGSTEQMETEADGEGSRGLEPDTEADQGSSCSGSEPEVSDEDHQSDFKSFKENVTNHGCKRKLLTCNDCGRMFRRKRSLLSHMTCHTGEKPFTCSLCGRGFSRNDSLKLHQKQHKTENERKDFRCLVCGRVFQQPGYLALHMVIHTDKRFSCSVCDRRFIMQSQLKTHKCEGEFKRRKEIAGHSESGSAAQMDCLGSEAANRHLQPHTDDKATNTSSVKTEEYNDNSASDVTPDEKSFLCSVCGKTFLHYASLYRHMRSHSGEKPFSCSVCNKSFPWKQDLTRHMKYHSEEKPFSCSVCQKRFIIHNDMMTHMRSHTGEKPFKCLVCGKMFTRKFQMQEHARVHTGDKTFKCEFCEKLFLRRSLLVVHRRIHTGEKPFKCSFCGKQFSQCASLNTHTKIHTGEKPHSCSVCGQSFIQRSNLVTHMTRHEKGSKKFTKKTQHRKEEEEEEV
ncbi:gastrula zinc finger protein XlCGF57.1-like isoform X2 [Sphaeramia orbicularis]|uniref:gastrula zinc finger protein XlCGF57.1-like isoform X2 n=1 Tax=Sphaeramia orbicularis TaxID=375764 RepID=UPI00117C2499|nr:gastrula zinc finger protein XlCGF57.1-like isoform X2 [Sphaeramia orbicularis]